MPVLMQPLIGGAKALVAGANIIIAPEIVTSLNNMGFLSPDGRCYSFDDRANGYARGEGCGIVVLKRVSDAIQDGDTIRAIIRSTGSNQNGHTPGITQPSRNAQASLIRDTYKKAGLDFATTRFFEAHGILQSGWRFLCSAESAPNRYGNAFGRSNRIRRHRKCVSKLSWPRGPTFYVSRQPNMPLCGALYIDIITCSGSVKSNIGHLEGGSGIAGLIKAILVLEKGVIPPNANFERINSRIDAEHLNIKVGAPYPQFGRS